MSDGKGERHEGGYVWRNGAEMEWECEEHCPHHEHHDPAPGTEPVVYEP